MGRILGGEDGLAAHTGAEEKSSSSSTSWSCHAASTDLPDPLWPPASIVHRSPEVFKAISCIGTECSGSGVHRSISLMSLSLLLQEWPACLVRLILIVFVMDAWWLFSCCFVGFCRQDFNIARSILVYYPSSFFSIPLFSVHVVLLYSHIDTATGWKKLRFLLLVRSDFHMTDSLSIVIYSFPICMCNETFFLLVILGEICMVI